MPFNIANSACTTGYDNGGAINCLIPTIIKNLAAKKPGLENASANFVKAFNEYHKTDFSQSQLLMAAKMSNNPVNREILLTPVLRRMLPNKTPNRPLDNAEILDLANKFGIKIETYANDDLSTNLNLRDDQSAAGNAAVTLRLKRDALNLWSYEEENRQAAALHNDFYLERNEAAVQNAFANIASGNFLKMQAELVAEEKARLDRVRNSGLKPKPKATPSSSLSSPTLESTATNPLSGIMPMLENGLKAVGNLLGVNLNNDTFMKGIGSFFESLFKLFSAVLPNILSIGEKIAKEIPNIEKMIPSNFPKPSPTFSGPNTAPNKIFTPPVFPSLTREAEMPGQTFLPMFNQFVAGVKSVAEAVTPTLENLMKPR